MTPFPAFDGSQNCYGHDTDEFFADHAGNAQEKNATAKAVCRGCAFLSPCYQYALTYAVDGVWGNTTAYERAAIRKARGIVALPVSVDLGLRRPIAHGTPRGYAAHRRLKERPCDRCRAAENDRTAGYKRGRAS